MLYRFYVPASPLDSFIEDFWFYDGDRPAHLKERIVPSGTAELVINLRDNEFRIYDRVRRGLCERFSGAIVSGPYERFFVIDTAEDTAVLGVHFKPGAAFPFFNLPVSELVDNHMDLETLWGRSVRELRERLRAATTPTQKFRILEAALRGRLSGFCIQHGAVRFALDALSRFSSTTVRDVTERVGLSQRRFIEVFKAEVGLTPKLFHRVQRFQRILALARRGRRIGVSWLSTLDSSTNRTSFATSLHSPASVPQNLLGINRRSSGAATPEAQPPPARRVRGQVFPIRSSGTARR
jgi:AraC-like DNA-binding protein